jgi:hypothetical protein
MAKYGRKIKRSKNLYKKRKRGGRKVLEIAAMLAVAGVLVFVGFAAIPPLWGFITGERVAANGSDDIPGGQAVPGGDNTIDANSDIGADDTDPTVIISGSLPMNAIYAPSATLNNITSLSAYIQDATRFGYNAVVLDMKDSAGHLRYHSAFVQAQNTEIIIDGALTAEQIIAAFEGTGVQPVARLSVSLDSLAPAHISDTSYTLAGSTSKWMDNDPARGGKFWLNPFHAGSRGYISFLVGELSGAGFTDIILSNVIFPPFTRTDRERFLDARYFDNNERTSALLAMIEACMAQRGSARLIVEMSLLDVAENYSGLHNTAELLRARRSLDDSLAFLLVFFRDDFGAELKTGESSSVVLPNDMHGLMNLLLSQAGSQTGSHEIIPAFARTGLSEAERDEIVLSFRELGFDSFAIR